MEQGLPEKELQLCLAVFCMCAEKGKGRREAGNEMGERSHTEQARKTREQGWSKVQVHTEDLRNGQSHEELQNGDDKPSLACSGLFRAPTGWCSWE